MCSNMSFTNDCLAPMTGMNSANDGELVEELIGDAKDYAMVGCDWLGLACRECAVARLVHASGIVAVAQ
jgi:hypothetical protein